MAKFIAVCVKDVAAETFGTPFCVPRVEVAQRQFVNEVNRVDDKNPMFTNAADFDLYEIGLFDDETGYFAPCMALVADAQGVLNREIPRPKLVLRGAEAKRVIN